MTEIAWMTQEQYDEKLAKAVAAIEGKPIGEPEKVSPKFQDLLNDLIVLRAEPIPEALGVTLTARQQKLEWILQATLERLRDWNA